MAVEKRLTASATRWCAALLALAFGSITPATQKPDDPSKILTPDAAMDGTAVECLRSLTPQLLKSGGEFTPGLRKAYVDWCWNSIVRSLTLKHQAVSIECIADESSGIPPIRKPRTLHRDKYRETGVTPLTAAIAASTRAVPQLLVRNVDDFVVTNLRRRAALHGVSAEEEHRRILREALLRPDARRPTLIEFLLADTGAGTDIELDIDRPRGTDTARDLSW